MTVTATNRKDVTLKTSKTFIKLWLFSVDVLAI